MRGRPKGSLNRSTLRRMSKYDIERLPLDQLVFCMEFWREVCDTMKLTVGRFSDPLLPLCCPTNQGCGREVR